ncbi:MAG: TnsA endonuclease N-terminal domain-containing protein [Bacillota bacterium]
MSKRKRTTTSATIERKAKEGRGQGHGSGYLPWLTIRDVPSQGLSTREQGWKTGRVHHFLSQQELRYFYILEWSPKTKESVVMTKDFLIDVRMNGATELKARTVKLAKDLNSKRANEKLEIERTYWQELGTDWGIVTENEIPESLASNVRWVHKARDLSSAPNISTNILSQEERRLILAQKGFRNSEAPP